MLSQSSKTKLMDTGKGLSRNGQKALQTILVVEDHPLLLAVVKEILEDAHFIVLAASSPQKALRIEASFKGTIDLLLSDVMMPGMNGPDLAKKIKAQRPQIRIILMSGYPNGALLILNYGWHFIQKPFLPLALVTRVRNVLKSTVREQGTEHFDTRK
jgi:DNA-binding response OmpR family regulator